MSLFREATELVEEGGIKELLFGIYRFIWWRGAIDVELFIRRRMRIPKRQTIAGTSVKFIVENKDELKRVTSFSGEKQVISWFIQNIKSTDIVWDVGANIGTYSLFSSSHAKDTVSFEPHPENATRLKQNVRINDRSIDIRQIALSDTQGSAHLAVSNKKPSAGDGSVSSKGEYKILLQRGDEITPPPDVVKIDVEGHELAVLEGLGEFLKEVRTIIIEVHDRNSIGTINDILKENGLKSSTPWEIGTRSFILGRKNKEEYH